MDTSCKDCVFAEYNGNTQIDCKLGKLDLYRRRNVQVDECYDTDENGKETEFFVIQNAACSSYRSKEWLHSQQPLEVQKKLVKQETRFKYEAFLIIGPECDNYGKDQIREFITESISNINQLKIKPSTLILLLNSNSIKPSEISLLLRDSLKDIKWRIEAIVERDTDGNRINFEKCVDIAFKKCKMPYYTTVQLGFGVNPKLFSVLNKLIHKRLFKFSVIQSEYNHCMVVSSSIHSLLSGNYGKTLIEKLKSVDDQPNLLTSWDKILRRKSVNQLS